MRGPHAALFLRKASDTLFAKYWCALGEGHNSRFINDLEKGEGESELFET
jgi:hypothetical protein